MDPQVDLMGAFCWKGLDYSKVDSRTAVALCSLACCSGVDRKVLLTWEMLEVEPVAAVGKEVRTVGRALGTEAIRFEL